MADLMLDLVKYIVRTRYEDLPSTIVEYTKKTILDTIAAIIAGSSAEGCREVVDIVKEWGGKEESTILIYGGRVPSLHAGFAIGPMARARDIGTVEESGPAGHVSEYVIPVVFPMAELQGKVNGKQLLTAVVLGEDITVRLNLSISKKNPDRKRYALTRIFGPVAASAKLLNLDEETTWNAMGIAFAQMMGEAQSFKDGALTVRLEHGFIAEAAIKSAILSLRGITGAKNILEGEWGLYSAFEPLHDLSWVTSGLGITFGGANLSIKPYPACRYTHGAIDATLNLVIKHNIKPEEVAEVEVGVSPQAYRFVCQPAEVKNNPRNSVDCQFSAPYAVANAIVKRRVTFEDFAPDVIDRSDVRQLTNKVKTSIDFEVESPDNIIGGGTVRIRTKDGKEYHEQVKYAKGHPKNPLSIDEVAEKFRICLSYSAKPLPRENTETLVNLVKNLESVEDVRQIINLLI